MINVTPVILCGGSGTRLWPLSRTGFPKQFLCLTGKESLFQQAASRLANLGNADIQVVSPIIVTGEEHRFLASEQLREIGVELGSALLEPVGRNTAPALTLAALAALEGGDDPVLVVTPADQTVGNAAAFTAAMQLAVAEAAKGTIVILGVTPDKPETGYGYIQINQAEANTSAKTVRRFVEKPDASTAQTYLIEGGYYWNAGMFVLKASVWLKALEQFRPDILQATQAAWDKRGADNTFVRPGKAEFAAIPSESVDYAAMEHCPGSNFPVKMVPLDAGWNDLGAWDAVWNVLPKDDAGNAHLGDVLTTDSRDTLVHATSRLVSLVGVEDLIVVETPDAVLVADKSRNQRDFQQATGLSVNFVQDNHSKSTQGVLRGLHYQIQHPQGKLVRVTQGAVFDVAVDLRRSSPNFGKWVGVELSNDNKRQLWAPPGFAHGFVVTSESAEFLYKTTDYWYPEHERSLLWCDPSVGVQWPVDGQPKLAVKDAAGRLLAEADVFD